MGFMITYGMKNFISALVVVASILTVTSGCADEEEDLRVSVNVTHDTKCNVIWVDVFGLDEKDNVPLGEGFFTSSNSADSGESWDTYFAVSMNQQVYGMYEVGVSRGWEIMKLPDRPVRTYFFAIDTLDWQDDRQDGLISITIATKSRSNPGELKYYRRSGEVFKLSGEPNRDQGCRARAEGGKTPEQIETVDDNPLKAEFHLSEGDAEGDACGFFFIDVFGLDESKRPLGPSLNVTIDGKSAYGEWFVPDEPADFDGFFEIYEWQEGLTDKTYPIVAELDDGTNTFTLEGDLRLNACE